MNKYFAVPALSLLSVPAFAAVDTTAITTALGDGEVALAAVGAAIIGMAVVAVVYKWIKGALFG